MEKPRNEEVVVTQENFPMEKRSFPEPKKTEADKGESVTVWPSDKQRLDQVRAELVSGKDKPEKISDFDRAFAMDRFTERTQGLVKKLEGVSSSDRLAILHSFLKSFSEMEGGLNSDHDKRHWETYVLDFLKNKGCSVESMREEIFKSGLNDAELDGLNKKYTDRMYEVYVAKTNSFPDRLKLWWRTQSWS